MTSSPTWIGPATEQLQELLAATAVDSVREHWAAYLKGTATFRGVPMKGVRTAVATVVRTHQLLQRPDDDVLTLAVAGQRGPTARTSSRPCC